LAIVFQSTIQGETRGGNSNVLQSLCGTTGDDGLTNREWDLNRGISSTQSTTNKVQGSNFARSRDTKNSGVQSKSGQGDVGSTDVTRGQSESGSTEGGGDKRIGVSSVGTSSGDGRNGEGSNSERDLSRGSN